MSFLESLKAAFSSLFTNKMRTFLTMLGIIIGIGSVIMVTSVGQGSQEKMMGEFSKLGVNKLSVRLKDFSTASSNDFFTEEDEKVLHKHPEVKYVSPFLNLSANVKLQNPKKTKEAIVFGVNEDYRYIETLELLAGRFFVEADNKSKNKVIIIDNGLALKVFQRENPIGEKITLKTWQGMQKYTIIGVFKNPNAMFEGMFGEQIPAMVYLPIQTMQKTYSYSFIESYAVSVKDPNKINETAVELTKLLERKHRNTDKYYVENAMKNLEQVNSFLGILTAFISFVAGISLVVGGVGVMNIMLVTVTERTREIGIRKSLGAKNKDILLQFLIEAIILTMIGGAIGMSLGYAGGFGIGKYLNIAPKLSFGIVAGTFLVCSAIGILFGVYPANKAAKLDPIEALRYE